MAKSNKSGDGERVVYQKKVGFFHMLRDVLVKAIETGQLPYVTLALIAIIVVLKYPPYELVDLVDRFLLLIVELKILGYVLAVVAVLGWFTHARWLSRMHKKEVKRLAAEKSRLQNPALAAITG